MIITKEILAVLRYIYRKKSVSYLKLQKRFKKQMLSKDTLFMLACKSYILQSDSYITEDGGPAPITEYTTFQLDNLGIAEVEKAQWFNVEFFIKQILLPIVIAVVTTLLTLCLSS